MYKSFKNTQPTLTVKSVKKAKVINTEALEKVKSKDNSRKDKPSTKVINKADKKSTVETLKEEINPSLLRQGNEDEESIDDEDEIILMDRFKVTSDSDSLNKCLQLTTFVQLPRFIFSPSMKKQMSTQGDKSPLSLKILGGIDKAQKINPYAALAKSSREGKLSDLTVELFDDEDNSIMTFKFLEPRIHAIDFGDFSIKRDPTELREIKVEFDYEHIEINDEEL